MVVMIWGMFLNPENLEILKQLTGFDPEKHVQIKKFAGLILLQFLKICTI